MRDSPKDNLRVPLTMLPVGNDTNKPPGRERLQREAVAKGRRTEKNVEIHEFYVIRTASGSLPALCGECSTGNSILVTPEQAAVVAGVGVRVVYRRVEAGAVHYRENPDGTLIVCVNSLLDACKQVSGV